MRSSVDALWERWDEVDSLLQQLLDLSPREREARLRASCAGDPELERTLRDLLTASEAGDPFPARPDESLMLAALGEAAARREDAERDTPERIGPYRILERIGRGGMGSVFLAERDDPEFPQRVALKVLRRGVDTDDVVARFRAERQILASLHHPGIASVFDAGTTADGRPYLVMEYVDGRSITAHCDMERLDVRARIRLFMAVARAIAHAHENGVVHRDLKPSNILITEQEQHVKLLDFGIAKILEQAELAGGGPATRPDTRPMTPAFASPEQVLGQRVTERTDIYQLGVLLYELLAGRRPFEGLARKEYEATIGKRDPEPPSRAALPEAAPSRATDHRTLVRCLRGDLDAIVGRALQRDPQRRYPSVGELHDDLAHYLDGAPVAASRGLAVWRRRRRRIAALRIAALLGVGIAVASGVASLHRRSRASVSGATPVGWLAIAPLADRTAPEEAGLATQVAQLLATNLARSPAIQVVALHRRMVDAAADGPKRLAGEARLSGAREMLTGSVRSLSGSRLELELHRVDLVSGLEKASYRVSGANAFALVDSATALLFAALGVKPPTLGVASITTSSLIGYRFYEEGLRNYYAGDNRAAYHMFSVALDEDSAFAMAAYHRALTNRGIDQAGFRADLGRAMRFAGRASERERLLILNAWALEMDEPRKLALADSLVLRYPAEPDGHLFVGKARLSSGDFLGALPPLRRVFRMDSAKIGEDPSCRACDALGSMVTAYLLADSLRAAELEARRWVALQRHSARAWRTLATTLQYQNRTEEALAARGLAASLGSENPRDAVYGAVLALRVGDFVSADQLLALLDGTADPLVQQNVLWYETLSNRYQGRLAAALKAAIRYRELVARAAVAGHPPLWAPVLEAQVLEEMGRGREAAQLWRQIASVPYEPDSPARTARHRAWTLTQAAAAYAMAGDTAVLAGLADTIEALGRQSSYGRDPRLHHYVRGLLLAARGDTAAAAQAYRRAVFSLTQGYGRINLELGRALLSLRRPTEAIPVLRGVLNGPLDAGNLYVDQREIHRLLARAYSAAGSPDSAAVQTAWVRRAVGG